MNICWMPVRIALPFTYLLTEPVLRTFLYHYVVWLMMMEGFDVMFSGKYFYKNGKWMAIELLSESIEPFTRLI